MDKFVIRTPISKRLACADGTSSDSEPEEDSLQPPPAKSLATVGSKASSSQSKMAMYKSKLTYDSNWKKKYPWMDYDSVLKGMVCSTCKVYGKVPVQARGAWVTRPVNHWAKATVLLAKHAKSDWHLAAIEAKVLSQSMEGHGVIEQIVSASEEERKQNREFFIKLIRSLYYLVKHHIPHTTCFEGIITLQIENGDVKLETHRRNCPSNATYESYTTITELLTSISNVLEQQLLCSLKDSPYFSLMADESTDIASQEELSICARWLHENKPVEHFLGVVHAREVNSKALTEYILNFVQPRGINVEKMRGLGFDGASTMSGIRSGVQKRLRSLAPSAVYVHCRCHQLQLAALNAANEHLEVKRVMGTLLSIWKAFHYSPKKAEKLSDIQAELNCPEIKMQKPSDTRWLARERSIRAIRKSLTAVVHTFEEIYNETGDAEAHGIAFLLSKYKTVACIYMLSDILHTVAKLQGSLQSKGIDLASVSVMTDSTIKRLKELKENPKSSTWFKDHLTVFTDKAQLGSKEVVVTSEEEDNFLRQIYRPYIQSVIDHINGRMESSDLISSMSVFDPRHLPKTEEELSSYGEQKMKTLIDFYSSPQKVQFEGKESVSIPDIDGDETESEWKLFRRVMFMQYKSASLQHVLSRLLENNEMAAAFPNLARLAAILEVLPVTTAVVERTFSSMKLVKTRLRSRMGEDTLDHTLRICIEGPDTLSMNILQAVVDDYKMVKRRKMPL